MFLCIFINDSRKCKSAHKRGKSNREKQLGGRRMTASLFTKLKSEIFFWRLKRNIHSLNLKTTILTTQHIRVSVFLSIVYDSVS